MFWKLPFDIKLDLTTIQRGEMTRQYGALRYFRMHELHPALQRLDTRLRPDMWLFAEIFQPVILPPHRDLNTLCALNFYIQPGNGVTTFFEDPPGESRRFYKLGDISVASSFQASSGETYLLDVSRIHDVTKLTSPRYFVQAGWTTRSFQDVRANIEQMLLEDAE